jgi:ligand-binding sensor domain-containing protein/signal transduction histidine kinase/DNA-binding response OmpR family regulator
MIRCWIRSVRLLLCLLSFLFTEKVVAQKVEFSRYTVEQGLSQNSILSIAQDDRGFMWMGTRYGLNRFDGHSFVTYRNNPLDSTSLSNNYINCVYLDSKKVLWIGSEGGLDRFDAESNSFHHLRLPLRTNRKTVVINCVYESKDGALWIGAGDDVFIAEPGAKEFKPLLIAGTSSLLRGRAARRIYKDAGGFTWVATSSGLLQLQRASGGYTEKRFMHEPGNSNSISDDYITSITEDKAGNLWIGTINGLNLFNRISNNFTRFTASQHAGLINNNIRTLLCDKEGKLWIGTQEGISILQPQTKTFVSYQNNAADEKSLSQNSVHSLFEDAVGSIWIGTFFGGVNVHSKYSTAFKTWKHNQTASGISNNVVSSIVTDEQNNLWIGTEGGGLNHINRSTGKVTTYKNSIGNSSSIGSNLVKTLYIDRDKQLWIGTHGGGLNVFDRSTQRFQSFFINETETSRKQSEIVAVMEDSEQNFWLGKHPGLYVFSRQGAQLAEAKYKDALQQVANANISYLIEDRKRNVWIGTFNGLYKFNLANKSLQQIELKTTNPVVNINCLKEDSNGNIWIGLYYGGLAKYESRTGTITYYNTKEGLPNNNVLGILEDNEQQLWLSTSNGLVKFNPVEKTFHTYTTSDGVAGNEFNYNAFYKSSSGELFFGGINGFTGFFPSEIATNSTASPIVFTGVKLFNSKVEIGDEFGLLRKDISYTDELLFDHDQHTFTIEFALLNYIKPAKNKYAYKLDGKEWTEINQPSATFTNMAAGDYVLWVKGSNNDGVWSEPIKIKISILPPFWKSWWAFILYSLLLGTVLFFIVRYFYLQALLRRDKELHQVKLNFFTNISHEIRTHLTLILTPVERMEKEQAGNSVLSHQLGNIKNNAERLLKLVSELMDFRKAETNHLQLHVRKHELISFLNHVYNSFEELSLAKNIRISFVHNKAESILFFDKEQMEKVIFNLLTNAFKFTPDAGKILLNVEEKEKQVEISVIDNGRGIAPEYLDKLFTNFFQVNDHSAQNTGYGIGLALSKNIVELHGGTITVESNVSEIDAENRTCFTVTLLKGVAHFTDEQLEGNAKAPGKENEEKAATESSRALQNIETRQRHTILVVEDNAELRTLVKETLRQHYRVIEAENGEQAVGIAGAEIPDVIISDVMMPVMDGFEFCKRVKTDGKTSHIPVILLTAKTTQSDHVSGLTTGADLYLTKPFSTQVLELSVRNLLQARENIARKYSKQVLLQPGNITVTNTEEKFLHQLVEIIEEYVDHPEFGVDMLAIKAAMSQSVLYKKLKALTNMSVNDFIKSIRLKRAAQLLAQKQYSVYEVGYMVGFNDRKYFSKEFKKQFGKTPSEFISDNS